MGSHVGDFMTSNAATKMVITSTFPFDKIRTTQQFTTKLGGYSLPVPNFSFEVTKF